MRRDDVIRELSEHKADLTRLGVKGLWLFGSVARDEARADSDLDILVEFDGPARFLPYMDLKFFLEELLHRPVDLATRPMLRPELLQTVEGDLRRVA
jgi:uncharacterized protein